MSRSNYPILNKLPNYLFWNSSWTSKYAFKSIFLFEYFFSFFFKKILFERFYLIIFNKKFFNKVIYYNYFLKYFFLDNKKLKRFYLYISKVWFFYFKNWIIFSLFLYKPEINVLVNLKVNQKRPMSKLNIRQFNLDRVLKNAQIMYKITYFFKKWKISNMF